MAEIKQSNRGGKRQGAGRKRKAGRPPALPATPDSARVVREWREKGGKEPLEVMLEAMMEEYETSGALAATPIANLCAGFFHSRLNNIDAGELQELKLEAERIELERKQIELELKKLQLEKGMGGEEFINQNIQIRFIGND